MAFYFVFRDFFFFSLTWYLHINQVALAIKYANNEGNRVFTVDDTECVGCNLCVSVCPIVDCITIAVAGKRAGKLLRNICDASEKYF